MTRNFLTESMIVQLVENGIKTKNGRLYRFGIRLDTDRCIAKGIREFMIYDLHSTIATSNEQISKQHKHLYYLCPYDYLPEILRESTIPL